MPAFLFPDNVADNLGLPQAEEDPRFRWLKAFLHLTKAATYQTGRIFDDGRWWVQFRLDLDHPKVWIVLQELSFQINNRAVVGKLPVKLIPWSGSPENGGPKDQLTWRIECYDERFTPDDLAGQVGAGIARGVTAWPPKSE